MSEIGFSRELIDTVLCRRDGSPVTLSDTDGAEFIQNGLLTCDQCGTAYRLRDGILDTINEVNGIGEDMQREIDARDKDAEHYDEFADQDWYRLEIPTTMAHLDGIDGQRMIEFGSGTGRFTVELTKRVGSLTAVDFSRASLDVLQRKFSNQPSIGLIQGDVTQMKFQPESYDVAVSTQLLQHIPSAEKRRDFLQVAYDCLKPGGYFLLTAYYQGIRRRLCGHPAEGCHESGIFFHYFTQEEVRREFSRLFEVEHIHPFLFHVPLLWRQEFKHPWIGKVCARTPLLKQFGSLILVRAIKRG